MLLRPISSLDEPETLPELSHGIPGVQWNPAAASPANKPASAAAADDARESYVLYVGLIFGVALVLRLLIFAMGPMSDIDHAFTAQTPAQIELADNLAARQTFGLAAQPEGSLNQQLDTLRAERGGLKTVGDTDLVPEFYRAPGYPAVLAVFHATGLPLGWLLLLQCVVGAACVPLTYWLGRGMIGRKAPAALGAVVVALHPALLFSSAALSADTLAVALVLLGLAAVASATRRDLRSCFGGGLALGAGALCTPVLGWLAPLVAAWMVVTQRRFRSVALAAAVLLGAGLPVGGWAYRNLGQGLPAELSGQAAMDRYFGTVAAAEHPLAGPYAPGSTQTLLNELQIHARQPAQSDTPLLKLLEQYSRERLNANRLGHAQAVFRTGAKSLALDHSLDAAYARLGLPYAPAGYAATLLGEPVASADDHDAVTAWVVNAWVGGNALLVVGMLLGTAMMLWHRRFAGLLLALTVTGYFLFYGSAGGGETLRLPLIGFQGLLLAAIVAPAPTREKKPAKPRVRKIQKLDDEHAPTRNSPLPQPDLRRSAEGASPLWNSRDSDRSGPSDAAPDNQAAPDAAAAAGDDEGPAYLQLVHPALRQGDAGR